MFQHQLFTQAELDADPRLAALLDDRRQLLAGMEAIAQDAPPSIARSLVEGLLRGQVQVERFRERRHYAAVQAENVRRGWKPATWREILGEPDYVPHELGSPSDRCCHAWSRRPEGWSCSLGRKCPMIATPSDPPDRERNPG